MGDQFKEIIEGLEADTFATDADPLNNIIQDTTGTHYGFFAVGGSGTFDIVSLQQAVGYVNKNGNGDVQNETVFSIFDAFTSGPATFGSDAMKAVSHFFPAPMDVIRHKFVYVHCSLNTNFWD